MILIDQLKKIYIDGELEVVDTTIWHPKVTRGDYSVGLNLTGVAVDDPDVNFVENYTCKSERNYTQYCNTEVESSSPSSRRRPTSKSASRSCGRSSASLPRTWRGRSSISGAPATCWHPHVKGFVLHQNSIYNDCAVRGRLARQVGRAPVGRA